MPIQPKEKINSQTSETHGKATKNASWAWYQTLVQSLPGMSANHSSQPGSPVYNDIRLLGAILGHVVADEGNLNDVTSNSEQSSQGATQFLLIEELRRKAKLSRLGDKAPALADIATIFETVIAAENDDPSLSSDQKATIEVKCLLKTVDAFRIFLEMASLVEVYHHNKTILSSAKPNQGMRALAKSDNLLARDIDSLLDSGVSTDAVFDALNRIDIRLVSTAHPTQILRTTYINHHRDIIESLHRFHRSKTHESQSELIEELTSQVHRLWHTSFVRWEKPTVADEAKNLLNYLDVLYDVLPQFHLDLECFLDSRDDVDSAMHTFETPLVNVASWIGGDMDGNPNTRPEVLCKTFTKRRDTILNKYCDELIAIAPLYSYAKSKDVLSTEALSASVQQDLNHFEVVKEQSFWRSAGIDKYDAREPYRQKLLLMAAKFSYMLTRSFELNPETTKTEQVELSAFGYTSSDEAKRDVALVIAGLRDQGIPEKALFPIRRFEKALMLFDFFYTGIDMREDASYVRNATESVMQALNSDGSKASINQHLQMSDADFTKAVPASLEPDLNKIWNKEPDRYADGGDYENRFISMMGVMRQAQSQLGASSCSHLLLSMTEHDTDVLGALLLMRLKGVVSSSNGKFLSGHTDIVPLFETIETLEKAPVIMASLFENPAYRVYVKNRNDRQIVLMAYSDSNKDGGYLTSQWSLYLAQKNIVAVAKEYGITIQFYHGRGGSIGRGGGPMTKQILSLPAHALDAGVQITEQGEVLARHYLNGAITSAHLMSLVSASLQRNMIDESDMEAEPAWLETMASLSTQSFQKYVALKSRSSFVDYFREATPREIQEIYIGSRPSKRRSEATIADLRAIPWVFRWFQSRAILPGWYGLGTALSSMIADDNASSTNTKKQLTAMMRDWPFFESLIDNAAIALLQSDMHIAEHYRTLLHETDVPADEADAILNDIIQEYHLTHSMLSTLYGEDDILGTEATAELRQSIAMKRTYLDPLNYIQVYLLKHYRREQEKQGGDFERSADDPLFLYHQAFISSTGGIVAGLGASG